MSTPSLLANHPVKPVEVMHGRVWCESEPGTGATFVVRFPAR